MFLLYLNFGFLSIQICLKRFDSSFLIRTLQCLQWIYNNFIKYNQFTSIIVKIRTCRESKCIHASKLDGGTCNFIVLRRSVVAQSLTSQVKLHFHVNPLNFSRDRSFSVAYTRQAQKQKNCIFSYSASWAGEKGGVDTCLTHVFVFFWQLYLN